MIEIMPLERFTMDYYILALAAGSRVQFSHQILRCNHSSTAIMSKGESALLRMNGVKEKCWSITALLM